MRNLNRVKFIGSVTYWNKKRKEKGYDPFALTSETYCGFNDPAPLFKKLLSFYRGSHSRNNINKISFKLNSFLITCPYCGERFEVEDSRVIRCPKCGNVIKKVDFKSWNNNLDLFLKGEITLKQLLDSPVVMKDFSQEIQQYYLTPDFPDEELNFRVSKYGFDKVYKYFSPNQLLTIIKLTESIRRSKLEERITLSLALIDFLTFNTIFSKFQGNSVLGIFNEGEPKVVWKWAELDADAIYYFVRKIRKREECNSDRLVSYPFTLDLDLYEKMVNFYFPFLKRALSDVDSFYLIPNLFKEEFFECLDSDCNSYVEKKSYQVEKDIEKIINTPGILYLRTFEDVEIAVAHFHVKRVSKVGSFYATEIEARDNNKFLIPTQIICESEIKGDDVSFLLNALSSCADRFTSARIIGIKDEKELLRKIYNETFKLIDKYVGTISLSNKVEKVYVIGRKYGKSKEFFKLLYRITGGVIVKYDNKSPIAYALKYLQGEIEEEELDYESKQIALLLKGTDNQTSSQIRKLS